MKTEQANLFFVQNNEVDRMSRIFQRMVKPDFMLLRIDCSLAAAERHNPRVVPPLQDLVAIFSYSRTKA